MQPVIGSMHINFMIYEIETEEDYQQGLKRFLELCNGIKDDEELKEMYLLMALMEKYERENCSTN
jgi:hypothetical protein